MSESDNVHVSRSSERLVFYDDVVLVLPDGAEVHAKATDMGHGGAFLEMSEQSEQSEQVDHLKVGDAIHLKIELFGRPSTFSGQVAHKRSNGIGLRLDRNR